MKKLIILLAALSAVVLGVVWHKHASDPAAPSLGEFAEELPLADIKVLRPWTWYVGLSTAYRAARTVKSWHLYSSSGR